MSDLFTFIVDHPNEAFFSGLFITAWVWLVMSGFSSIWGGKD